MNRKKNKKIRKNGNKKLTPPGGTVSIQSVDHNFFILYGLAICILATLAIGITLVWFNSLNLPSIYSIDDYQPLNAISVVDRDGKRLGEIYRENRIVLAAREIPPLLGKAFVAAEDGDFWRHSGLDFWSIFRALINNVGSGRRGQGGSTITQQVTRALMLTKEKTYYRKVVEAILAYRLDRILSKEDILTIYLNEIYLGEGAYGVEAAARTYFGRCASELSLAEITLLAGLPQAPSRYSPLEHFEQAKGRQKYVLNRMAEEGYISADEARSAFGEKIVFHDHQEELKRNGYFLQLVQRKLEQRFNAQILYHQAYMVTTTLRDSLQRHAFTTLTKALGSMGENNDIRTSPQGALVALDSATGSVMALIGGRDYLESQYNRAVDAKRQAGSIIKPVIYAAAFEHGISPEAVFYDAPLTITTSSGVTWQPENNDGQYVGPITLRDALVHSNNIVTVKLLQKIGTEPVINLASSMGIQSPLQRELVLALGSSGVDLLEITEAYSVFANNGIHRPTSSITSIRDSEGRVRLWGHSPSKRVLSPDSAGEINQILREVISKGTGQAVRSIKNAAGKTGTTNNNMDAWFIGYNSHMTTGIWVGHDRDLSLGKGGTGGQAAAPIWRDFMAGVEQ